MQFISGRPKVIVTVEDIKNLVAKHFKVEVDSFDLEITDLPSSKSDPWYPDNSGKWVEVDPESMEMPSELRGDMPIHCLLAEEREGNYYKDHIQDADCYAWDNHPSSYSRIVAYKLES